MRPNTRLNLPPLATRSDGTIVGGQLEHFARTLRDWSRRANARVDIIERAPVIGSEDAGPFPPVNRRVNDMWWTSGSGIDRGTGPNAMLMRRIASGDTEFDQIVGGNFPHLSVSRATTQGTLNNDITTLAPTATVSRGGAASPNVISGLYTVPVGFGGMFQIDASCRWASNGASYRLLFLQILSGARAGQITQVRQGGHAMIATLNNGNNVAAELALSGGATFDLRAVQSTGGALNVVEHSLSMRMTQHRPDW